MTEFTTRKGAKIHVVGDPALLTMDRIQIIGDRFDSDPRIASVSVHYHPEHESTFLRATAPAGVVIAIANNDLVAANEDVELWATQASERGLWHDWWLTNTRDMKTAPTVREPNSMDLQEREDPSGSHFEAFNKSSIDPNSLTLTIDVTWLGPHETGAQVLTTAAIPAIANQPSIKSIRLVGLDELPAYAAHLTDHPKVSLATTPEQLESQTDVIWYPNQIDQRIDISQARQLGKRVITTYLDLIAYDIARYHGSPEGWAAYRGLQRKIALSVDGITTISKDVAKRLYEETPRLDHKRIQAILLGLDHLDQDTEAAQPTEITTTKPFLLVLGNDFQHKNRDFAIKVWQELLNRGHQFDLVLAGLHVKGSSSKDSEKELTNKHVNLRGDITTLGHVTSQERTWLLKNAQAVIYPSSAEGFGFVPHEAAALETTSTFADFGPLKEVAQGSNTPKHWRITEFANDLEQQLADPNRTHQLRAIATDLTWNHFADKFTEFAARIVSMPTTPLSTTSASSADTAALAHVLSSRSWKLTKPLRKITKRN